MTIFFLFGIDVAISTPNPNPSPSAVCPVLEDIAKRLSRTLSSGNYVKELRVMHKKHDIVSIMIVDEREQEIPDVGLIELEDEETGEQMLVDTSDDSFREEYCKITKKHETDLAKKLGKIGVGFAKVLSNEPYEIPLRKLFRYRMV